MFAESQMHAAVGAPIVAPALHAALAAVPTSASRAKSALRSERILPAIVDRGDSLASVSTILVLREVLCADGKRKATTFVEKD